MTAPIRVVVADGSAFLRQSLRELLRRDPGIDVVGVAGDAGSAWSRLQAVRPDVVVLDEQLPDAGRLAVLERLLLERLVAVVLLSTSEVHGLVRPRGAAAADLQVAVKPRNDLHEGIQAFAEQIAACVKTAFAARRPPSGPPRRSDLRGSATAPREAAAPAPGAVRVIAMGASTGGTVALRAILNALPGDLPGIVIVQHMPERFTGSFAEALDRISRTGVRLARDGDRIVAGQALVAPGGCHLEIAPAAEGLGVRLFDAPRVNGHRPSVDVLFRSVAAHAGREALGVLLTGMGTDGARGLLELQNAGGRTVVQDESSSVVFGMPREAITLGAADRVAALDRIPGVILGLAGRARTPVAPTGRTHEAP